MKFSELIAAVGDANTQFQALTDCITGITTSKKGVSKITFGTMVVTANEFMYAVEKQKTVGFILWIPRDKIDAAIKDSCQTTTPPPGQSSTTCEMPRS